MEPELRDEFKLINEKLDKLAGLPDKVASLAESFAQHVEDDRKMLMGDGENPGLMIKVDRLERSWATHQKFFYILVTAVVGIVVEGGWRLVEHLK